MVALQTYGDWKSGKMASQTEMMRLAHALANWQVKVREAAGYTGDQDGLKPHTDTLKVKRREVLFSHHMRSKASPTTSHQPGDSPRHCLWGGCQPPPVLSQLWNHPYEFSPIHPSIWLLGLSAGGYALHFSVVYHSPITGTLLNLNLLLQPPPPVPQLNNHICSNVASLQTHY